MLDPSFKVTPFSELVKAKLKKLVIALLVLPLLTTLLVTK